VYTRCTGCHTAHPVNARLLAQGGGKFRCGKCQKVGNALEALFDEWPGAGERPPTTGDLPVLGLTIDLERARKSRQDPDPAEAADDPDALAEGSAKTRGRLVRLSWILIAVVVALIGAAEYAEFRGKPLASQPLIHSVLTRVGIREPVPAPVFRDLDQIQLVSRELISHPFKDGRLQLRATIVNRAQQSQPFPELEVLLLDPGGEVVSEARFSPSDYLAAGTPANSLMTPEAFLPLVLELPDPGRQAVGFELKFH
jgi:predicted Zn finger-like uncharacterized protein